MDFECDVSLFAVVRQDWWSPLVVGLPSLIWIWNKHAQLHRLCEHQTFTFSDPAGKTGHVQFTLIY